MVTAGLRVRNLTDSECPVPHSVKHPTPSSHLGGDGVTQTASGENAVRDTAHLSWSLGFLVCPRAPASFLYTLETDVWG